MKNFSKKILLIMLLLTPTMVFASSGSDELPILAAIGMEAFVTIHMTVFVLLPLSKMLAKENSKKLFWKLFIARVVLLLFFDLFITTFIALVDFIAVFIGAFLVVPICASITKTKINTRSNQVIQTTSQTTMQQNQIKGIELKCAKCNTILQITDKFCANCGTPFDGNNIVVTENKDATIKMPKKIRISPSDFDQIYNLPETNMLNAFIGRELKKCGIDETTKLIPSDVLKRKKIFNLILSFLVFIYITLIFFHFPLYTYIIGGILLLIFFKITRNYNLIEYLKKEIKSRPSEKITNIVMNAKNTFIVDNTKKTFIITLIIATILPLIIFYKPRIIYEKTNDGYAVRYYAYGLTNFKTAVIPETYKGKKIVSLRGNTFSNMTLLESVKLPNTITEIRGQAFKDCHNLKKVNIPNKLEYLGGGAFYNAKLIKEIYLPDTLNYLGGEAFYEASSLEYIKLSENLSEIRGDSFAYCTSLKNITIPDKVTRIGGHAFYGASSLKEVQIGKNSQLKEIGSSAFRQCDKLYEIRIPKDVYVNERAFKESPTTIRIYGESYENINKYETFMYINIGNSKKINEYRPDAIIQNETIKLENIAINNGLYEFTLNVDGQVFTLTNDYRYHIVNDNLTIEIKDNYVFESNYGKVSLYAYYN